MTLISQDLDKAISLLNQDELIAIPTETVYGLAGNIYSEKAIRSIFALKKRPLFNPLIVHIHSIDQLENLTTEFPEKAKQLAKQFWPGPLTLLLKKHPNVPDLITAGKDTVAIRIPNHPLTLALLSKLNYPLAAPSANPFGSISPTNALHVADYFVGQLPMVLEGGQCKNGIESTIVGFENGEPILYRLGAISQEDIERVVGQIPLKNKKENAPEAPGMLSRHYAPSTTTYIYTNLEESLTQHAGKKIGVLAFQQDYNNPAIAHIERLSTSGSLVESAAKLYAALHTLDRLQLDVLLVEKFPDNELGKSINDRLERATKK
ncbi:MAG: threonylcarbamoyl-AMP synthase [Flavobacterium sp.]|nr:threonylcarbamoyl-AMP synthase [Flavobacterium sp.]